MKLIGLAVLGVAVLAMVLGPFRAALLATGALVIMLTALAAKWAFWPRHTLPRHRIRHMKLRLFLHLHPGPGHATIAELHRHWGRRASALKDRWARP